jgi:hypothetical protein
MRYSNQKPYAQEFPQYAHLVGVNTGGLFTLTLYHTNEQLLFAFECDLINHLRNHGLKSL